MITNSIVIFVIAFTVYVLVRMTKSNSASTAQDDSRNRIYKHMFAGGCIGFIIGFGIAILFNPPFKGIWDTPNDVQGLIIASWLMGGGLGALLLAFAGLLIGARRRKKT